MQQQLAAPGVVLLNVYDVSPTSGLLKRLNQAAAASSHLLGGIFHSGVEVHGQEWSYGLTSSSRSGVFNVEPRKHPRHAYRVTAIMGATSLSTQEVQLVLARLQAEWPGDRYSLLHRNCHSFSNKLLTDLGLGPMPGWVDRAPRLLSQLDHGCCLCQCGLQRSRARSQVGSDDIWIQAPECGVMQPSVGALETPSGPLCRASGDGDDEEPDGGDWHEDVGALAVDDAALSPSAAAAQDALPLSPGPWAAAPEPLLRSEGDAEDHPPDPGDDVAGDARASPPVAPPAPSRTAPLPKLAMEVARCSAAGAETQRRVEAPRGARCDEAAAAPAREWRALAMGGA